MLEIANDYALGSILMRITDIMHFLSDLFAGFIYFAGSIDLSYDIIPVLMSGFVLFMLIYSVILLVLQTTFGGGFMARLATFGAVVCFGALVLVVCDSLLGISGLLSNIFSPQYGAVVGLVICVFALFAFMDSVITLFSSRRVKESYDSKKVGSSVVIHRILYFVFCILAVPVIILL